MLLTPHRLKLPSSALQILSSTPLTHFPPHRDKLSNISIASPTGPPLTSVSPLPRTSPSLSTPSSAASVPASPVRVRCICSLGSVRGSVADAGERERRRDSRVGDMLLLLCDWLMIDTNTVVKDMRWWDCLPICEWRKKKTSWVKGRGCRRRPSGSDSTT